MNEHHEQDPLDALRAADLVDADRLSSASLARIRARVKEDVMTTTPQRRGLSLRTRLSGIGAAAIAVGAVAFVLILGRPGGAPGVIPPGSVGPGMASCVERYAGPNSVANRGIAFDGTVASIDGERVTFTVIATFRGADGASITLDAAGMTGTTITSAGGPNLEVGQRYLVAGEDHFAWACGYTQQYDAALAAQWAAAAGN